MGVDFNEENSHIWIKISIKVSNLEYILQSIKVNDGYRVFLPISIASVEVPGQEPAINSSRHNFSENIHHQWDSE